MPCRLSKAAAPHLLDDEPPQLSTGAKDKHRILWLALPWQTSAEGWLSRAVGPAHAAAGCLQEEGASPEHCRRHAHSDVHMFCYDIIVCGLGRLLTVLASAMLDGRQCASARRRALLSSEAT